MSLSRSVQVLVYCYNYIVRGTVTRRIKPLLDDDELVVVLV